MMIYVCLAFLLCSTYCSAQNYNTTGNGTQIADDKTIWEEIAKAMDKSGMARTDVDNLDIFDAILFANANERGRGAARTDTNVFLFEGDIQVSKKEITGSGYPNATRKRRALIRNNGRNLWGRTIYYILDASLGGKARNVIASAIKEWHDTLPCITWTDITGQNRRVNSYMHFFVGGGCYSQVGRVGGGQKVSIGRGCEYHGIAVHEIGHAMGLWHEQSRPDRDSYVRINWNNIIPATRFNFQKQPVSRVYSFKVGYDYESVMHYGAYAFTRARNLRTIERLSGSGRLGQRVGLSAKDKEQVKLLYKCTAGTTAPPTTAKPTSPTVCRDASSHSQWCIESKKLSLCDNNLFKSYMGQYCCKTCMPTPPPTTRPTTSPTIGPTGCQNKQADATCKFWAKKGYCKKGSTYYTYMKDNCCKSCCVPGVDKVSGCVGWKASGYCTDTKYGTYMERNCAGSCGVCNST